MRHTMLPAAGFAVGVLATASVAQACGMGHGLPPDSVSMIPGFALYRPDMLLLLPILSGTIERPLYSMAGYRIATLGYSIQANFLATIASNLLAILAIFFGEGFLLLAALLAPVIAIMVKLACFGRVPRDGGDSPGEGLFILATILSTATIAIIPVWMTLLGTSKQSYAAMVVAYQPMAIALVALAGIATHIYLFSTVKRSRAAIDPRRGFEVLASTPVTANAVSA